MPNHILISLSADPPGLGAELEAWNKQQVENILKVPGFLSGQVYRRHPDHDFAFPETRPTRPPYRNLSVYELDDAAIPAMVNRRPGNIRPPQPPGGMGPHRSDGYLFVAVSPLQLRAGG